MENEELKTIETDEGIDEAEETEEETGSRSVLGTVGLMAIGSGITLGIIAGVKKLKKVVADRKTKKNAAKDKSEVVDAEFEPVEPAKEQDAEGQTEETEE